MIDIESLAKNGELFDGHYLLIRPLSVDGATADVWLALDANTVTDSGILTSNVLLRDWEYEKLGLVVAIKIYRPQNALDIEGEQRFRDEYMIVYNCHHTNLIHPTNFSIYKDVPYLVLPYCKRGSSELLVGQMNDNREIWKFIEDVGMGLDYLHNYNPPIIHQDIKPANILLDDTFHYAITDFGISAQRGGTHGYYYDDDNSGTLAYMASERFEEDKEPIPPSDIWAFGATLYELITGKVPFGESGGRKQSDGKVVLKYPDHISSDVQRLIAACLDKDPQKRPTARQIVIAAQKKKYNSGYFAIVKLSILAGLVLIGICMAFVLFSPDSKEEDVKEDVLVVANHDSDARRILFTIDDKIAQMSLYIDNHQYDMYGVEKQNEIGGVLGEEVYIVILQKLDSLYMKYGDSVSDELKNMMNQRKDSVVTKSEQWADGLIRQSESLQKYGSMGREEAMAAKQRADRLKKELNSFKLKYK